MSKRDVSNNEDIVDSRDIISRIEELQDAKEEYILNESAIPEEESPSWGEVADKQNDVESKWDETDEGIELKALLNVQEQAEGYASDWRYGSSLIRDTYMNESWAREELQECGMIPDDLPNVIESNINWEGVLEDLKQDYTSIDWDGVTYWI